MVEDWRLVEVAMPDVSILDASEAAVKEDEVHLSMSDVSRTGDGLAAPASASGG